MSAERKRKLKKSKERQARKEVQGKRQFIRNRASLDRAFQVLGLHSIAKKFPRDLVEILVGRLCSSISVTPHEDFKNNHLVADAVETLNTNQNKLITLHKNGLEYTVSLVDVVRSIPTLTIGIPYLAETYRRNPGSGAPEVVRLVSEAEAILNSNNAETLDTVLAGLLNLWHRPVDHSFRIDRTCLVSSMEVCRKDGGGVVFQVVVGLYDPSPYEFIYRGSRWTTYPCISSEWPDGLARTTWNCGELGIQGPDVDLQVFVTKHAVSRLQERLALINPESYLHRLMALALQEPVLHKTDEPETYLVEACLGDDKLGYFVANILPRGVLVRTFLFLTMKGTPESEKLRSILGLHRNDIEYYRLDSLQTFGYSDIMEDPVLVKALRACGCEHLLSLFNPDHREKWLDRFGKHLARKFNLRDASGGFNVGGKWFRSTPRVGSAT